LTADIYLLAADDKQATEIRDWLSGRSEVEAMLQGGRADTQFDGAPLEAFALPDDAAYQAHWPLLQSSPDAWTRLRAGDAAFVSEQLAERAHIGIGDTIELPTPTGDWKLRAVGIYADYGNPKSQVAVDVNALMARFPQAPRTRIALRVKPGSAPALMSALSDKFGLGDRDLIDQAALKADSLRVFNRTFAVTAALNAFTLGVAGIALLTSLLTLANSRLPQLAPLWAAGMTRRQLAGIELTKTLSVALITALLALPLGLLVAWCLIAIVNVKAFGWRLPFQVFPLQLIKLLGVAMAASLAASLLPVARLARMQPANLVKVFANER
jgi:putative ABC transport system permease protein